MAIESGAEAPAGAVAKVVSLKPGAAIGAAADWARPLPALTTAIPIARAVADRGNQKGLPNPRETFCIVILHDRRGTDISLNTARGFQAGDLNAQISPI